MIPFWKKTDKHSKPQSVQKRRQNTKPAVPRTAQQSIPMQRMFEDGTCRVKPNYYTRTIQYQDINYQLAQQEDKTAIFEEFHISTFSSYIGGFMNENDRTTLEQAIYEEMELTPEMIRSIRTLCGVCLCSFVESKAFKIAIVPSADRSMDTCTVCQTRRGHDYVVMKR